MRVLISNLMKLITPKPPIIALCPHAHFFTFDPLTYQLNYRSNVLPETSFEAKNLNIKYGLKRDERQKLRSILHSQFKIIKKLNFFRMLNYFFLNVIYSVDNIFLVGI